MYEHMISVYRLRSNPEHMHRTHIQALTEIDKSQLKMTLVCTIYQFFPLAFCSVPLGKVCGSVFNSFLRCWFCQKEIVRDQTTITGRRCVHIFGNKKRDEQFQSCAREKLSNNNDSVMTAVAYQPFVRLQFFFCCCCPSLPYVHGPEGLHFLNLRQSNWPGLAWLSLISLFNSWQRNHSRERQKRKKNTKLYRKCADVRRH